MSSKHGWNPSKPEDEHESTNITPSAIRIGEPHEWVDDSLEYEFVQTEELDRDTYLPVPLPAENFQGTWDGTFNEGKKAYKEVAVASSTYYSALANSSLSKAAFSLGGALAGTANRTALNAADYAVKAAGSDRSRIPGVFGNWLKGKEKFDEAKKRKMEAEKARLLRKYKQELIDAGEVVDNPSRPGSRASSFAGQSVGSSSPLGDVQSQFAAFQTPAPVRRQLAAPLLGENGSTTEALQAPVQDLETPFKSPLPTSAPSVHDGSLYLSSPVRASPRRSVASRPKDDGFEEEALSVPEREHEKDGDDVESAIGLGGLLEGDGIDL